MNGAEYLDDEIPAVSQATNLLSTCVDRLAKARSRGIDGQAVVTMVARTVPGAQFADLLAWRSGELVSVAASAGYPPQLDAVRTDAAQGPCYDALKQAMPVISDDLTEDARWPTFGLRSFEQSGVRSVISYRVHLSEDEMGALSCYSDWPYGFDELAVVTGRILAACVSITNLSAGPS